MSKLAWQRMESLGLDTTCTDGPDNECARPANVTTCWVRQVTKMAIELKRWCVNPDFNPVSFFVASITQQVGTLAGRAHSLSVLRIFTT